MRCSLYVLFLIFFFSHISRLNHLHSFVYSLCSSVVVHSLCDLFHFLHIFTAWRFGAFFSVVLKSLALVTSEWKYVLTLYYILFYFSGFFWGVETVNICICLDYFVIAFYRYSSGVSNTLFAKVGFYLILGTEKERTGLLTTLWWVQGVLRIGFYFKVIGEFLF